MIYTEESSAKYYMSPYVRIHVTTNGAILHQTLFNQRIHMQMMPEHRKQLLDELWDGCSEKQLKSLLMSICGSKSPQMFDELLRGGFVE